MIVVDIETSGLDKVKCGIWQIGAYDLDSGEDFLEEARIDHEDRVLSLPDKPLFEVIGKTEEQLRDNNKQSQKQMLEKFFSWVFKKKFKNFVCQNPQFDIVFLEMKAGKYGLDLPFHHRAFDLHSVAQIKYFDLKKSFLIESGFSKMGLSQVLDFCGLKDERKCHNALEDAKLTAECFSRLVYGKSIFPGFKNFKIPDYLKK